MTTDKLKQESQQDSSNSTQTKSKRVFTIDDNGDQLLPNGNIINWNKGMINQMKLIGNNYHEWIRHPKLGRVRLYDNDLLESLSNTYWFIAPCIFILWSFLEFYKSLGEYNTNALFYLGHLPPVLSSFLCYMFGLFSWTLFEYFAHRFAFHWEPPIPALNLLHFFIHGLHHLTPNDGLRLVFPPFVTLPLGFIFQYIFYKILFGGPNNQAIACACFGGFLLGYTCYESIHYLSHHNPFNSYLQQRYKLHSKHHFNPYKQNNLYGVTSQIWDHVFGTM